MRLRISWLVFGFFIGLTFLTLRLVLVMVFPHAGHVGPSLKSVRLQSEIEHLQLYRFDDGRGRILFRNGQPWSGQVAPALLSSQRILKRVSVHQETTRSHENPVIGTIGLPDTWPSANRTVEEEGRSGLEYTFDNLLRRGRPGYFGQMKAAVPHSWNGKLFWLPARPGIDIKTTVDTAWQRTAEDALRRHAVGTGAVVVLDVKSRDILAMASHNRGSVQTNQAVKAQIPGSVFKIITAAAAWDSYQHSPLDQFYCNGLLKRPGVTLRCWRRHGRETLLEAFAGSCNVAFATMGIERGPKAIQTAADRFGLLSTGLQHIDGHSVLPEVERGRVFALHAGKKSSQQHHTAYRGTVIPNVGVDTKAKTTKADAGVLAHTVIGQQDVRLSPLHAANMAATVASGGFYQDARLVVDAQRRNHVKRKYTNGSARRAVSSGTAAWLQLAMHMTAHRAGGTAVDLSDIPVDVAVKTGTAQVPPSTRSRQTGSPLVNSWIVGFAPYKHPQIAFAVYVGKQGETIGHRQVHAVVRDLLTAYMQFTPTNVIG